MISVQLTTIRDLIGEFTCMLDDSQNKLVDAIEIHLVSWYRHNLQTSSSVHLITK